MRILLLLISKTKRSESGVEDYGENKMTNEKQEKDERSRQMLELMRNLGATNEIEIYTPTRTREGRDYGSFRGDYEAVSYSVQAFFISSVDNQKICSHSHDKGYRIYKHIQIDYRDNTNGACFEVEPQSPSIGLRSTHFAFNISKNDLLEKLTAELEKQRRESMRKSSEDGKCVLEQLDVERTK